MTHFEPDYDAMRQEMLQLRYDRRNAREDSLLTAEVAADMHREHIAADEDDDADEGTWNRWEV